VELASDLVKAKEATTEVEGQAESLRSELSALKDEIANLMTRVTSLTQSYQKARDDKAKIVEQMNAKVEEATGGANAREEALRAEVAQLQAALDAQPAPAQRAPSPGPAGPDTTSAASTSAAELAEARAELAEARAEIERLRSAPPKTADDEQAAELQEERTPWWDPWAARAVGALPMPPLRWPSSCAKPRSSRLAQLGKSSSSPSLKVVVDANASGAHLEYPSPGSLRDIKLRSSRAASPPPLGSPPRFRGTLFDEAMASRARQVALEAMAHSADRIAGCNNIAPLDEMADAARASREEATTAAAVASAARKDTARCAKDLLQWRVAVPDGQPPWQDGCALYAQYTDDELLPAPAFYERLPESDFAMYIRPHGGLPRPRALTALSREPGVHLEDRPPFPLASRYVEDRPPFPLGPRARFTR